LSISIFGQYESEINVSELKGLIEIFPEEEAILHSSTIDYTFKKNLNYRQLEVIEKTNNTYIALKANAKILASTFYDSYSELNNHRFISPYSNSNEHFQRCGNYEVDGIFYHDAKVCNFFMEIVKPGGQMILKTTKTFLDPRYFTHVFLGDSYSVAERIVRFHVPPFVKMEIVAKNFSGFNIERKEYVDKRGKGKVIEYKAINLPASLGMENLPGPSCVFPHLLIMVKGFSIGYDTVNVIRDNNDLYKWYKSLIDDPVISPELKTQTEALSKNKLSDSAKIASIYNWVQSNIRYIAFEDGIAALKPKSPIEVFSSKYGDCKGMANLVKAMLVNAGFDARLCWIGTSHVCYGRDTPSVMVDNHMICAVKLNGQFVFLDPTVNYTLLGEIHEGIQGKSAIVEDGDGYLIVQVPTILPEDNFMYVNNEIFLTRDTMIVEGSIMLGGVQKYSFQDFLNNLQSPDKKKMIRYFITQTDNNYTVNGFDHTASDSIVEKFEIGYNMVLENNVIDLGDELLVDLHLYKGFKNATIDSTRSYAYSFGSRLQNKHRTLMKIPEGFYVKSTPSPINIDVDNYKITANYELTDSTIIYNKEILIREETMEIEEFDEWNSTVQKLKVFYGDMVILSRK